ncbi:MAG: hypothetical protein A3C93_05155 [Candidatus Lloydbacteria bacterium RIFCSPHIGHO2_02_FULL_54_17]|uniref:Uncharacterized protein n=1 Tax=Candidatus Lloydbacteria bacterium RIFCSPHIGHO2_02_FULL_54_17 TaxID=1798664 RepID=A0A1G2DEK3_9BACT|nr:MAG: hypothetical protein A2762_05890 [Candidatus Lloydbacteria bacterium RIFCSPHIGHO2_01_FULL_54_11]OGZ11300.1 MAG: hypothetical protein A3C93_05155 [Candidatus Lloydbacteria bacterium RIFCSPHIGHO2_02_FULL_54_17]
MKKLTLAGVSYDIRDIEGMIFLVPSRLRKFERRIEADLKKSVTLLKKKGWYEYVLMADMIVVTVPSKRKGDFGEVFMATAECPYPVYFSDSGMTASTSIHWVASVLVHEAMHVFQEYYLSLEALKDPRKQEVDACREQKRFLRRCKRTSYISHIDRQLKKGREWWKYLYEKPKTKRGRYCLKRDIYFDRVRDKLARHIPF